MKSRRFVYIAVVSLLVGCSFTVDLAFYNNTSDAVEICNLNLTPTECQLAPSNALVKVRLISDRPAEAWQFSIRRGNKASRYSFKFGPYPQQASDVYCVRQIAKKCDIPIQYEPNEQLYWAGESVKLPVERFPGQPDGFPVRPVPLR